MIDFFVPLLASFFTPDMMAQYFNPLFMLYFIAAVPGLIRLFISWR